jgi:hypothetical protein
MSTTALLVTLILEVLLATTRFIATWLKKREGNETVQGKWLLIPYSFKLDYWGDRHSDSERIKPPKLTKPRSRRV